MRPLRSLLTPTPTTSHQLSGVPVLVGHQEREGHSTGQGVTSPGPTRGSCSRVHLLWTWAKEHPNLGLGRVTGGWVSAAANPQPRSTPSLHQALQPPPWAGPRVEGADFHSHTHTHTRASSLPARPSLPTCGVGVPRGEALGVLSTSHVAGTGKCLGLQAARGMSNPTTLHHSPFIPPAAPPPATTSLRPAAVPGASSC